MAISRLVADAAPSLTPSERRVADAVLSEPEAVAFGTVARLAAQAQTSGPTVVRFATKLGFRGFAELQAEIRNEMTDALRPATARIRERPATDVLARVLAADLDNVRTTLENVHRETFDGTVALLAARERTVYVLAGETARGVGIALVTQLDLLRDGVVLLGGSPVRVARQLAELAPGDVLVAIEQRRYERWLLDTLTRARGLGADVVALTDRPHAPVAEDARHVFVVAASGVGPFDSHTATMALVHALAAGVAARLRRTATARLDAVEAAWSAGNELVDG